MRGSSGLSAKVSRAHPVPIVAGAYALAGGLISFLGYPLDIPRLTAWDGKGISIQPNATVCTMTAGAAVILLALGTRRAVSMLGLLVGALGGLTFLEYITPLRLPIHHLLLFGREWGRVGVIVPGRMGPPGSLCWTLIGVALWLASRPAPGLTARRSIVALAMASLVISATSICGYLYGADRLFSLPRLTVIALQTATFILALSISLLALFPDHGMVAVLRRNDPGGLLLRRMLVPIILLPLLIGWLRVRGQAAGLYDTGFGSAATALVMIVMLATLVTISARQVSRASALIAEQGERLRTTLASIGDAVISTDAQGRVTMMNGVAEQLTGWTQSQARGRPLDEVFRIVNQTTRQTVESPVARALRDGQIVGLANHTVLIAKDGTERPIDDSAAPIRCAQGEVVGCVLIFRDISRRRAQERALRDREQALRFAQRAANAGTWTWDRDSARVTWSPECYELFGIDPSAELLYDSWRAAIHPDDRERADRAARQAMERGESLHVEYRINHRLRGERWLNSVGRIVDPVNHPGFMTGLSQDITERKQAEQALEQARESAEAANIAKDNFLATLSHELRTPLTPVLGTLGLWEHDADLPPAMHEDVKLMRRNLELEARLIDDLLDLTRIVKGKIVLNLEVVEVHDLVRSVARMFESDARAKKLEVEQRLEAPDCYIRADAARLQQALWNLMRNAIKFTPERGRIAISTRNDARGNIQVIVEDSGIGIAQAMLLKLFRPFEQGDAETVKRYGGLGLGLAITRTLLEAQKGTIEARSEGAGKGATFIITLPCAPTPPESRKAPAAEPARHPALARASAPQDAEEKCFRILLVEDHQDTAYVMMRVLRSAGHEVESASSVRQALDALGRHEPFDILLCDIGLPDGTGIELMRQIRQRYGDRVAGAIAMTGFGMEEDVARCKEAGFHDHLTKPVNFARLENALRRVGMGLAGIDCTPGMNTD